MTDAVCGAEWGAEACRLAIDALDGSLDVTRPLSVGAAYAAIRLLAEAMRRLALVRGAQSPDEIDAVARATLEVLLGNYLLEAAAPRDDDELPA